MKQFTQRLGLAIAPCLMAIAFCAAAVSPAAALTVPPSSGFVAQERVSAQDINAPVVLANNGTLDRILTMVFTIVGGVCLLFVVIGALRYTMSNGNQSQTKQAKDTIIYAMVGAVITFGAFTVVQVVLGVLYN